MESNAISTPRPDADAASARGGRNSPEWNVEARGVYLIGIGGCGMSGLARLLQDRGAECSGSDRTASSITDGLERQGIPVTFDQDAGEIPADCDLVITSAAITPDHPERLNASARGVETISYAQSLGRLMLGRTGVSVAGTHGKSTTTAMLAHVLTASGLDPSFIVGATCPQIGGGSRTGAAVNPRSGEPGIVLAEACEFNRSFHHHRPTIAAILNIEEDHLDIYGSIDEIIRAFHEFARLLPDREHGGRLLIHHELAHRTLVAAGLPCEVETIGLSTQADWRYEFDPQRNSVTLERDGVRQAEWTLHMPGEHNAANSAFAAVLAHTLGCTWKEVSSALSAFRGLDRRMQRLGERTVNGGRVVVYDDYGHHPTEIDSTLRALRAAENPRRLICVFQPHQHSRTRFLLEQFAASFESADVVIVPHIYFVRDSETEKHRISAADLVDRLRGRGVLAMHLYPFDAIVEQLEIICREGDLLVVMGAGPVWQVAHRFLAKGDVAASATETPY